MSGFDWIFGYRNRWTHDPSRRSNQKEFVAERRAVQDSIIAEQDKRKADGQAKPKYTTQQMIAMLPEVPITTKSVDEIVHEGLTIINLLDQL